MLKMDRGSGAEIDNAKFWDLKEALNKMWLPCIWWMEQP